jgi:tetratricopeptide (TPR) repeat protein
VSAPIPPASSLNPELPPQVDDALARGLAKEPEHRYDSAADIVNALREALDDAAGGTAVGALPPVGSGRERRWVVPLIALGALLLAAGALAAVLLAGNDQPKEAAATAPQTVKETVTLPGQTVVKTVTTEAAAPTTAPETAAPAGNPVELSNQGFELMKAGNYQEALPLLEQAVARLSGSGSIAEAYASYNLAFTRLALGRCDGVIDLLTRSEQVQGRRKEITRLSHEAEKACGGQGNNEG